ncbi:PEP-CTERM system histidine kinase PrsK [Novosphingobium sp. FSY-8]|uniref:histidine kinase n=1 Tax=Novosphingobium ovatum TaxID=1908523 RepID=A0ABW9XCZ9_9SPHN|nr:XrtA/PEP-CTERM system histidine kinase PrsK [Novosphingobium ovatum]NBC36375.1 PEP-CTERM system histidine kinase PrsK [Novosphingobium ovatum]
MTLADAWWAWVGNASHVAGACAATAVAASIWSQRGRYSGAGLAIVASLAMTAVWCLVVTVKGQLSLAGQGAMGLRNLTYLWAVYRMFASDGRHTRVAQVGPVVAALALVDILVPAVQLVVSRIAPAMLNAEALYRMNLMLALLGVIGSLVLVHNLYASASREGRAMLRWPAMALGLVWVFELNLYTVAYLSHEWPRQLAAVHGVVDVAFAIILALGSVKGRETLRLSPSRSVTFQSFSLLMIGGYLAGMVAVANWLSYAGGDYARWLQLSFVIGATVVAALTLPSRRMRGWLRVTVTKHLFQHRYDYRAEWLRFTETIGGRSKEAAPLHERAVRALADITDSPAGLLLMPDEHGDFVLAARWQWLTIEVPACAIAAGQMVSISRGDFIVELDELRAGHAAPGTAGIGLPQWLREEARAWVVIPLIHNERVQGAVVLARPEHSRKLDWEDFDLLRVAGQQVATYLAENASQVALVEASRFDDFHRRIAFVMHDIKNLASQFALLARNAERHAENPAFRADMLVTLRNSADKLNHLVARLSRYGGGVDRVEPVELGAIARELTAAFQARHNVQVIERDPCTVAGQRHAIEQVIQHLVQNSIDASTPDAPVFVHIANDDPWCRIEIVDSGHGMSPDFIRTRLFKPFVSTKAGGFGIGAYEARELVRAMHGRLDVESREGLGTRFIIRLPLQSARNVLTTLDNGQKVA